MRELGAVDLSVGGVEYEIPSARCLYHFAQPPPPHLTSRHAPTRSQLPYPPAPYPHPRPTLCLNHRYIHLTLHMPARSFSSDSLLTPPLTSHTQHRRTLCPFLVPLYLSDSHATLAQTPAALFDLPMLPTVPPPSHSARPLRFACTSPHPTPRGSVKLASLQTPPLAPPAAARLPREPLAAPIVRPRYVWSQYQPRRRFDLCSTPI